MLSRTPEGRGSQPGQRGAGRDHPRSDKRVQAPGGGPQSERLPCVRGGGGRDILIWVIGGSTVQAGNMFHL